MNKNTHIVQAVAIRLRAERLPVSERRAYIDKEMKEIEWMLPYTPIENVHLRGAINIPWKVCDRKDLPEPSAAELLIIDALNQYNITWAREVEFLQHRKSEYGLYRYDFYLPTIGLVIEYDGVVHHSNEQQIANDAAKDLFCRANGIDIVRLDRKHYYHMDREIGRLMDGYGVKKKNLRNQKETEAVPIMKENTNAVMLISYSP